MRTAIERTQLRNGLRAEYDMICGERSASATNSMFRTRFLAVTTNHYGVSLMKSLFFAAAAILITTTSAHADSLGSRSSQRGVITQIDKGAKQLFADSTMILGYTNEQDDSTFHANLVAAGGFRYFVKRNLGVSLRVGGVYRDNGETNDKLFAASLWANWFARLGEGMFAVAGVGAGFQAGNRDVVSPGTAMVSRSNFVAGTGATELMLAVFLNRRFSLAAGPELLFVAGSAKPDAGGDSSTMVSVDGGFKITAAYAF